MTSCFGYTRVSTAKQGEGVSLEAQKDAITQYAEKNSLTVTRWFEEKETAAKAGRPVFNALVKELKAGKAQGLITHKIDRSARNFRDWALIGDLADLGIGIHFATETLDFGSRGGRLAADVQAVVAADYIRNLREECIKGLKGRLKQGLYPFKAPLGYLDNGGGKAKTHDPACKLLVKEMFELYASGGYSFRTLREEMKDRGLVSWSGKPLNRGAIENMLSNPFYCGIIKIQTTGETYKGVHEPLITVQLFERVQMVKSNKCGKKIVRHNFTYRRLFRCAGCQYRLVAERQKGNVYYRCHTKNCSMTAVREEVLERQLLSTLGQTEVDPIIYAEVSKHLRQSFETETNHTKALAEADMQIASVDGQITRLTDAMIDRLIDQEDYKSRREALLIKQQKLMKGREEIVNHSSDLDHLLKFLELAKNLAGLYRIASPPEKRQLVELATSNLTVSPEKIECVPSFWLRAAIETMTVPDGAHSRARSRTLSDRRYRHIEKLFGPDQEPRLPDLVAQLGAIFEKHGNLAQ